MKQIKLILNTTKLLAFCLSATIEEPFRLSCIDGGSIDSQVRGWCKIFKAFQLFIESVI